MKFGLARQLHASEEYTAKQLGIQEIWEPTPFPIEIAD